MILLCWALLEDLDVPDGLPVVLVKGLSCSDPAEIVYFSVGHEAICYFCGTDQERIAQETDIYYPLCSTCNSQEKVRSVEKSSFPSKFIQMGPPN